MKTPDQRFDEKFALAESGCWLWIAATSKGYGWFWAGRTRSRGAHRYSYERSVGPIPDGLFLDHLCGDRRCVNPDHLEPVTNAENMRRASLLRREHQKACVRGHLWTKENTYVRRNGSRVCRRCRADQEPTAIGV